MKQLWLCIFSIIIFSCKTQTSYNAQFSSLDQNNQIKIKTIDNFRFLGGLKNSDGKILKDSLIYRSGNLHQLKTKSFEAFERLKINKIIDLRTKEEISKAPDRIPKNISYQNLPAFEDENGELKDAKKLVLKGKFGKSDANERMLQFYRDYLIKNPEIIKKIITEILNSEQPIVYHCTAGKDRTGMITALILKILKFDDTVIFEEYLQSNNLRKQIVQKRLNLANTFHFVYPKLDIGVIEKTGWIERNYLQSAFDEINIKYGSMNNYIHEALGISESQRDVYIKKFLK